MIQIELYHINGENKDNSNRYINGVINILLLNLQFLH